METLQTACIYGADAVYLGMRGDSSLRAYAKNFSREGIVEAVRFAHSKGVKVYLALNTYPHDKQYGEIRELVGFADQQAGIDAFIVSDVGVLSLVRQVAPTRAIHMSTQANTVSTPTVNAWASLGASRVILARELSNDEIELIRKNTNTELETLSTAAYAYPSQQVSHQQLPVAIEMRIKGNAPSPADGTMHWWSGPPR